MTLEPETTLSEVNDSILLTHAQSRKNLSKHLFNANSPDNAIHRRSRPPEILRDQFRLRCVWRERRGQSLARVLKPAPVPLERQQCRLTRRHALFRQIGNDVKQPVDPRPCFG